MATQLENQLTSVHILVDLILKESKLPDVQTKSNQASLVRCASNWTATLPGGSLYPSSGQPYLSMTVNQPHADRPCAPCSYATRVIGSQLSPSFAVDEQAVMQGIIQDLQLQGKADAAMR